MNTSWLEVLSYIKSQIIQRLLLSIASMRYHIDPMSSKKFTCTPAEFMYMKMGFVGLSYCRYMSSARSSSVTAGINDMPCIKMKHKHCLHHLTSNMDI